MTAKQQAVPSTPSAEKRVPPVLWRALLLLFVLGFVGLLSEITLTRIFSLFFQYNYTFLAVSLAVLGISLGAAWGHWQRAILPTQQGLSVISLALILFVLGALWLPRLSANLATPLFFALLALLPFAAIGLITAQVFAQLPAASPRLYAADLIGAGSGLVAVFLLLTWWSPFTVLLFAALVIALVALILPPAPIESAKATANRPKWVAWAGFTPALLFFLLSLATDRLDYCPACLAEAVRDKTMFAILQDPTQQARISQTAWSPFARVDVVESADPSAKFVFADGGAGSYMLQFTGDLSKVERLRHEVEFIPFAVAPPTRLLVLGAGAGKDLLAGLLAGATQIDAVEVNPAIVAVTRADAAFNGAIFDHPAVNLTIGDARTFVERSQKRYDLVYLNVVYSQVAPPASQALVESYIFTQQAIQSYWRLLNDDGHLAIIAHNGLEGSRAFLSALRALQSIGIEPKEALDHLALWMLPNDDPTLRTSLLILAKAPLTPTAVAGWLQRTDQFQMTPLFVPGKFEMAFQSLRQGMSLASFIDNDAAYNLAPVDDDSPFFFHLDPGLPTPVWQTLLVALALTVALLLGTLRAGNHLQTSGAWPQWGTGALLGLAFMLIEIPLIQHFQLLLGYPLWSLTTVLGTLLLAGGVGSLLSPHWLPSASQRRIQIAACLIALIALLYWWILPVIVPRLLPLSLTVRWLATLLLTALVALPMGVPFAALIQQNANQPHRIALLWSLNGACSVLGSALALAIAMSWGFSWALLLGAILYGGVALLMNRQ